VEAKRATMEVEIAKKPVGTVENSIARRGRSVKSERERGLGRG